MSAIKVYTNLDQGAPTLTGQLGTLLTVLQAVLVDGYGSVPVASINRSGSLVTVVTAAGHGLAPEVMTVIAGAAQADYNGEHQVTVVDPTTFTYNIAATPTTPATGTITAKRAPAGFATAYTGSNKSVYRSNDLSGTRKYLQVIDDGAGSSAGNLEAVVRGFDTMSSTNLGTGAFPSIGLLPLGYIVRKSNSNDSTSRPWTIITDGLLFYFWVQPDQPSSGGVTNPQYTHSLCFGDAVSYKVGDTSHCVIGASMQQNYPYPTAGIGVMNSGFTGPTEISTASLTMAKDVTETAEAKAYNLVGGNNNVVPSGNVRIQYPNAADNGLYITAIQLLQSSPTALRGVMPGIYESLHGPYTHRGGDTLSNVTGLAGRKLRWMPAYNSSQIGGHFIDVTGPWR